MCRSTMQTYACKSIDKLKIPVLEHLQSEVELLAEMNHGGITKMVDCYEDSDFVHIVIEKYTGGELFDKIVENTTNTGCYSEKEAACINKSHTFMKIMLFAKILNRRTFYSNLRATIQSSLLTLDFQEGTPRMSQ